MCSDEAPALNLDPWYQVTHKADQFFEQVQSRHAAQMQCATGCADCCRQDLSVLVVEAVAILAALDEIPPDRRTQLGQRGPCALLLQERCTVYPMRPLICRTHGLPIRYDQSDVDEADTLSCCQLNFTGDDPPAGAVINGSLLLAGLTIADSLVRQQLGLAEPRRLSIFSLVERGWEALLQTSAWEKNGDEIL